MRPTVLAVLLTAAPAWAEGDLPACGKFDGAEMTYACRCAADMVPGEVFGTRMY